MTDANTRTGTIDAAQQSLQERDQAVPDGCLSLRCQLPHDDAEAVVKLLNEWTESDARRAKEETTDER